jgi:hypothetical protein
MLPCSQSFGHSTNNNYAKHAIFVYYIFNYEVFIMLDIFSIISDFSCKSLIELNCDINEAL